MAGSGMQYTEQYGGLTFSTYRSELFGGNLPATPGHLVREVRSMLSLSQADLARLAEISQPGIARLESDAVSPTHRTLTRLLQAMGERLFLTVTPDPVALAEACLTLDRDLWRGWERYASRDYRRDIAMRQVAAARARRSR